MRRILHTSSNTKPSADITSDGYENQIKSVAAQTTSCSDVIPAYVLRGRIYVKNVFDTFADASTQRLTLHTYQLALKELQLKQPEFFEESFYEEDSDMDGEISFDEFCRAINRPFGLEQWCSTLPLAKLLGFSLAAKLEIGTSPDPIRRISILSSEDILVVSEEFC